MSLQTVLARGLPVVPLKPLRTWGRVRRQITVEPSCRGRFRRLRGEIPDYYRRDTPPTSTVVHGNAKERQAVVRWVSTRIRSFSGSEHK